MALEAAGPRQDVGHEEQPRGPLDALDGHQEALQRQGLVHGRVGHHVGAQLDLPTRRLQDEHLEEVRGHRHVVLADHLVLHIGLPVGLRPGQEERPGAHVDVLVGAGQAAGVLLQVVPGVLVEVGHLGRHVAQVEGVVHGLLAPAVVGGGGEVGRGRSRCRGSRRWWRGGTRAPSRPRGSRTSAGRRRPAAAPAAAAPPPRARRGCARRSTARTTRGS